MIRLASPTDTDAILAIYAPVVRNTAISFEIEPPSHDEMHRRIADTLTTLPWLVLEANQKIAAYVKAGPHKAPLAYQWSVDVSVYVDPQSHRHGYGRRLYRILFEILRAQGYYTAFAGVALPNEASVGLHEALGFKPIGVYRNVGHKFGEWRDVGWWRLPLREYDQTPEAPRILKELEESGEVDRLLASEALK